MSREKCQRAVRALRAGEGEFRTAERACEEAKGDGATSAEITAIWSEGLPGGLGARALNMGFNLSYEVGDVVISRAPGGGVRALVVAQKTKNVRYGQPGFWGHSPGGKTLSAIYDKDIVRVLKSSDGLGRIPEECVSSFGAEGEESPYGSHLGFRIATLDSYSTPYYYAVGPAPLGSRNHFQTIRQLKSYMNRLAKAGKLPLVPSLGATFTQDEQPYGSGLVPEWAVVDTRSGLTRYHWFTTRREAEAWNAKYNAGFVQSRAELDVRPWEQPEGLGLPPEDHRELLELSKFGIETDEQFLRHALGQNDCAMAFGALLSLTAHQAQAHTHATSAESREHQNIGASALHDAFFKKCVRRS